MRVKTNVEGVTACIVRCNKCVGADAHLELYGDTTLMDAVDVYGIAAAHGYFVDDIIDETTLALIEMEGGR